MDNYKLAFLWLHSTYFVEKPEILKFFWGSPRSSEETLAVLHSLNHLTAMCHLWSLLLQIIMAMVMNKVATLSTVHIRDVPATILQLLDQNAMPHASDNGTETKALIVAINKNAPCHYHGSF